MSQCTTIELPSLQGDDFRLIDHSFRDLDDDDDDLFIPL